MLRPWEIEDQEKTERQKLLQETESLVSGDRNNQYGPPHQDFSRTAGMLNALGFRLNGEPLRAHNIAMILSSVKLSRLVWSPDKRDNWVDLAGYAACGWEAHELTEKG